ncbi:MAG TPA: hypothetical protein VIX86_04660 [Streptosporangiaceae bacterium]
MSRRRRHNPLTWFVALLVLVAVLNTVSAIEQLAVPLLVLAAVVLAVRAVTRGGWHPLPPRPPKVIPGRPGDDTEVIRLRAEVEALRAERDQAQEATRHAWVASTEPDARAPQKTARDRLLTDRLSGVHRLTGGGQ